MHLVAVPQEIPHALVDVMIDRSIGHQPRPVAKVVRPPPQNAIEAVAYLRPRCDVVPHQQVAHFLPQPGNALLRRTRPQIHMTILPKTMRPERISQKVEKSLRACLMLVFASFSVSPIRVITLRFQFSASAAQPRLRITKSSA